VKRVVNAPHFWKSELIDDGERTLVMVKVPSRFGANFGLAMEYFRFLASSQTLSPLLKGVKLR